jgi:nitric oxide dioxygenase
MITQAQIALVQQSWAEVEPIADTAADLFYERLFEVAPQVRPLFKDDMSTQKKALMGMLATAVRGLPRIETILPAVQALGRRHVEYGAIPAHYDAVGACLLDTLAKGLGDGFTDEVREAWTIAYGTLATVMIEAGAGEAERAA